MLDGRTLVEEALASWRDCPDELPRLGRTFAGDQEWRESQLARFVSGVQAEARRAPRTKIERRDAHARITAAFAEFAGTALGLERAHIELMLGGGLSAVGTDLARQARRFDPSVSVADILQANRNAWTACGLQLLFGKSMRLTPAIFAYSMLYPYTDNYLDDPAVSGETKRAFNGRFGRRLAGEAVEPANGHESAIWRLVGLIEGQYSRPEHPAVFESLLAIHRAQENSLRLLRNGAADVDVLRLSFEKGGASVLADGYLAAGTLTAQQARFVFHWGVALQLADDLQDVLEDRRDGVRTLFTEAAGREPLDSLTNRTLQFGARAMALMRELPGVDCVPLTQLVERSCTSLVIRSAGEAAELYTRAYVAALERHSPFRFSFLAERRRQLEKRGGLFAKFFEAFLAGDEDEPAFPVLPSSLMPRL